MFTTERIEAVTFLFESVAAAARSLFPSFVPTVARSFNNAFCTSTAAALTVVSSTADTVNPSDTVVAFA